MNKGSIHRVGLFILFLLCGLLLFVVFSHFRPMLPADIDIVARASLIIVVLAAAWLARRNGAFRRYRPLLVAFLVASVAMALDLYLPFSRWALRLLDLQLDTPAGLALDKLESTLLIVVTIIVLTKVSGGDLASIYLKAGNLRRGLVIGLITFSLFAAVSFPLATWMFGAQDLSLARVMPWVPWLLIFVLGNALNEELLFRGLFLRKLEPLLGTFPSNLLIAIAFALSHTGVDYTTESLMFLATLLPLALAWGYIMQRTDSLWGSLLFHAGTDIAVMLGIFSNLA